MTTATVSHSPQRAAGHKSEGVMNKVAALFMSARQAKADSDTLAYLRRFEDSALMDFGYSYDDIRELRSGHLKAPTV